MDLIDLAKKYKTPLYVYDLNKVEQNFLDFKNAFIARKSLICYALKANSNLSILNFLANLGAGADCVSIGEVKKALAAGIPKYKIIFSGVGKSYEEIEEALNLDILFLNLESQAELDLVESVAKKLNKIARISIRVNPNIDAKTHPYISTGLHENKFGVDIQSAKSMYLQAHKSENLSPVGIHFHIGSQICDLAPIEASAAKIADLARSLLALNIELKFFDIGGGVGIQYTDEETIKLYDYAQAVLKHLSGMDLTIICEPGRRIIGDCGVLISSVLYEKRNEHKRFVIVDSGMNNLVRPALYGAIHKIVPLTKKADSSDELADVVGPICESSDTFIRNEKLPSFESGDLVAFLNAGAYGASMSNFYNIRSNASEVAFYNDKEFLIKDRASFEDLIKDEKKLLESNKDKYGK